MRFPSDELYEGKLVAAEAIKARLLQTLPYEVQETEDTVEPVVFFDTQGGDFPEKAEDDSGGHVNKSTLLGDSKSNEMEAAVVAFHVKNLVEAGLRDEDIAVVTPYNAQLALLSSLLKEKYPNIELGSVDGFQGREKEAVVVSLVRSNAEREIGFLGEKRRLNGKSNLQIPPLIVSSVLLFMLLAPTLLKVMHMPASYRPSLPQGGRADPRCSCHDKTEATSLCDWGLGNCISRQSIFEKMDEISRGQCRFESKWFLVAAPLGLKLSPGRYTFVVANVKQYPSLEDLELR
jgi:hypothetical protein